MYTDKVEVLRFDTEPYRKHMVPNGVGGGGGGSAVKNGTALRYNNNVNGTKNNNSPAKHSMVFHNGYYADSTLIEKETKSSPSTAATAAAAVVAASTVSSGLLHHHHVQPPSDPFIASVLHSRQNPRPGRLILENVNNRPQTMDRGTQANTDPADAVVADAAAPPPSTSSNEPTNNSELYRNANIGVTNQKLLANGGDNSSVDSQDSADSAKRDSEESVIEIAELNQPMITKDDTDGHQFNMSNGDGKYPGAGGKPSNGIVKEHPVDDDVDKTSCGMECLYFAMQCCECTIM